MADGRPPAPQLPQTVPPAPPVQLCAPPIPSIVPPVHPIVPPIANPASSYATIKLITFKPEFMGKPDEDAEAHLLRTNDRMDTHTCSESVKVQHFCLTLVRQARLYYKSLRSINVDGNGLQNQF